MNSENSKMSSLHRLLLNLSDKMNLKRNDGYVDLSNLGIYYTGKNIKKLYKTKIKISAPNWNDKFQFPDESYSVSNMESFETVKQ